MMAKYKVATIFDVAKRGGEKPEVLDWDMILSHPGLEDVFLFYEDVETYFFDLVNSGWDALEDGHIYRVFFVFTITPEYSYNHESGKELDGWDWGILILTYEDLGKEEIE